MPLKTSLFSVYEQVSIQLFIVGSVLLTSPSSALSERVKSLLSVRYCSVSEKASLSPGNALDEFELPFSLMFKYPARF